MRGGSPYISLSSGWFSIKCHLLTKIFLGLGTDGLCCVTKGINPRFELFAVLLKSRLSFCKFDFCEDFVYQIIWIASDTQVWYEIFNVFLKCCLSSRVGYKKPKDLAFDKSFLHAWTMTGREMVYWNVSVGLKCVRMSKIESHRISQSRL